MPRHFTFHAAFLEAFEKSGLSQQQLAAATGVAQSNISRFISTGKGLSLPSLDALARELGIVYVVRDPIKRRDMLMHPNCENQG